MKNHQIVISGAGYVGILAALSLLRIGFECIIIETKNLKDILEDDGKSFALSAKTINLLKKLDLFEEVKNFMQPINKVYCFENDEASVLLMEDNDLLGGMISSHKLKVILLNALKKYQNFQLIDNFSWKDILYDEISKKSYIIKNNKIDEETIEANLIISTEGRNSKMIDYFNLERVDYDYNQQAIVFNIEHEFPHNGIAVEKFFPEGAIALLPLISNSEKVNHSAVVWINDNLQHHYFKNLNDEEFLNIFNKKIDYCLGKIQIISSEKKIFPLKLSFLKKYYLNNILFLGDINHAIHPIAGQGFNLTIGDLNKLVELVKEYDLKIDLDKILKKFHHSRVIPNLTMIGFTHFLVKFFGNQNILLKKVRNFGIKIVDIFY
jgi:2-octaprenyl-6-methoxyphenol hydroxylase